MSKSKGDFLTVSLLEEKGYSPLAYRMFCLQSHYRKPLEFSFDTLDNVSSAYIKLLNRVANLKDDGEVDVKVFEEYDAKFKEALSDDLNTSMAITIVYDALKADTNDATKKALIGSFDKVLSLGLLEGEAIKKEENNDSELESYVLGKIEERAEAKKAKDYAKADAIRAELLEKGIAIEDTREGVKWKRI